MGEIILESKLNFTRLYFRKSKNKKGQECFISKIKSYTTGENGQKLFTGDVIVVANSPSTLVGAVNTGCIDREGRYDVECKLMQSGKGYIVTRATWTIDILDVRISGFKCQFLINGSEDKLRTDDGKFIPLSFDAENYYDPEKIVLAIERKLKFVQVPDSFNKQNFLDNFYTKCDEVNTKYKKALKTGEVKVVEEKLDISKLQEKWMQR